MATIDIKDFLIKEIAAKFDRILMTNSQDADAGATISVQDFCLNVIQPLIESLSLAHSVLKQSEYDALEVKKEKTFYIIKESGRIIRTYIGANPLTDGETFFRVVDDFWQISYDGGKTYAVILDNNGMKVSARGDKVMLRLAETGIEYRYESEPDTKYRLLVPIDNLLVNFDNLTDAQIEKLKLHFSDLTESDIKELQRPAEETIARLEQIEQTILGEETERQNAESSRNQAELSREEAEQKRQAETDTAIKAAKEAAEYAESVVVDVNIATFDVESGCLMMNTSNEGNNIDFNIDEDGNLTLDIINQ